MEPHINTWLFINTLHNYLIIMLIEFKIVEIYSKIN